MQKQDYLKIMAIVILLLLIFDVIAILNLNGYKPTITAKDMKSETKEVLEFLDDKINNYEQKEIKTQNSYNIYGQKRIY